MTAPSFDSLRRDQLARLLDVDGDAAHWSPADAAAALRHQLAAALLPDLAQVPGAQRDRLEQLVRSRADTGSFLQQLTSLEPDVELLESIKRWARHTRADPGTPLHGGPATVLYYAAIAAALARRGTRITKLSDDELREGFAWAVQQAGAEALRTLFEPVH